MRRHLIMCVNAGVCCRVIECVCVCMYVQVRAEHARMVSVYTATGSTQGNTSKYFYLSEFK